MTTRTVSVPGIHRDHPAGPDRGGADLVDGGVVDLEARQVTVDHDPGTATPERSAGGIEEQGSDVPAQE